MSLQDGNYQNKQRVENTYYSRFKIKNNKEKLMLTASYWKGMLKISISEEKPGTNYPTYDELAYIHLSPMKAAILSREIDVFVADSKESIRSYGVNTGISETQSFIVFRNLQISSTTCRCLEIGKIDPNGTIIQSQIFPFNSDIYNYGCEWDDMKDTSTLNKTPMYDIEVYMFKTLLNEYIKGSTGGIGYSTIDMGKYDQSTVVDKLNTLLQNQGLSSIGDTPKDSNKSFFNKNTMTPPLTPSKESDFSDIEALL